MTQGTTTRTAGAPLTTARHAAAVPAQTAVSAPPPAEAGGGDHDLASRTWTSAALGSLAYCLFALQQPGPVGELRRREQARSDSERSPVPAAAPPGVGADPFLRRQNVLGELSLLDF